ncbi:amidase signature enzyme [Lentinula edodes]|uniref:Amidase signature enzyme n=1 Tax=Lentinula edodes TaxID=5353 RepID=A0A1Q3EEH3_LENED|nr:amidase signature enzyme [Lentinula edodes]
MKFLRLYSSLLFLCLLQTISVQCLITAKENVGLSRRDNDAVNAPLPDLYEASILELQNGLDAGQFTSVDLIKAYFARIEEVNLQGPVLRAVIETNPSALAQAAVLDAERAVSGKRSLLHGIPVILKVSHNIDICL